MANYQKPRVQLTNKQFHKLKSTAKNRTGTILTLNKKNFEDEELPNELFLTTRQRTIKNAFANNMWTDRKLIKTSRITQSGGSWLANLDKKALKNVAISLVRDNLPGLVNNLASNAT